VHASWIVAAFSHEQPDPAVWEALVRAVDEWNRWDGPRVDTEVDGMRLAAFDETQQEAQERLVARLRALPGAVVQVSARQHLDQTDYDAADLVGVSGMDPLDGFVVNESAALIDLPPCSTCGQQDLLDREQVAPLRVDEEQLDEAAADGSLPGGSGWDLVGLPHGGLAVSRRLVAAWETARLTGVVVGDLLAASTGRRSERVVQVTAARAVLPPCPEHTVSEGAPHCPACGRARSNTIGLVHVRPDQVGTEDLVSAHPQRHALLYLSRRAYESTLAISPAGLVVQDAWSVCRH
jgi:hypothetical protein